MTCDWSHRGGRSVEAGAPRRRGLRVKLAQGNSTPSRRLRCSRCVNPRQDSGAAGPATPAEMDPGDDDHRSSKHPPRASPNRLRRPPSTSSTSRSSRARLRLAAIADSCARGQQVQGGDARLRESDDTTVCRLSESRSPPGELHQFGSRRATQPKSACSTSAARSAAAAKMMSGWTRWRQGSRVSAAPPAHARGQEARWVATALASSAPICWCCLASSSG